MAGTQTVEICVVLEDAWHELLIAELADLDFDVFETDEGAVRAYIPSRRWTDVTREAVEAWLMERGLSPVFSEKEHHPENWNRIWEETARPVAVGPFLIKPTWAEVPPEYEDRKLLEIDPKMSFGTGYHESTRLALQALSSQAPLSARVLDAGTGTGVLAIAAARLGAARVVAFDNDEWSYVNATENCLINEVNDVVAVRLGSLEVVEEDSFDLILANINRNALLEMLPAFRQKLAPEGRLVLSGLLLTDREAILQAARNQELSPEFEHSEGEWWCCSLRDGGSLRSRE